MPIGAGRGAGSAAEHGTEGADAVIAEVERHLGHGSTAAQPAHGLEHASLLAPCGETEACLTLEKSGHGALTGMHSVCPFAQGAPVTWLVEQGSAEHREPLRARHRHAEGLS